MNEEINYPNYFIRVWRCLVQRRKTWRLARASSILALHALETDNDPLYEHMMRLHDELWLKVYKEEND